MKTVRVLYVHNVCMHYKAPVLTRLAALPGIELHGVFGQSHWNSSKLRTDESIRGFAMHVLPTIDLTLPYRSRGLHLFWNPSLYRTLSELKPDAIIAGNSNFPNNLAVMRYAKRFAVPYIWHGIGSVYRRRSPLRRLMGRPVECFFRGASAGLAFNSRSKRFYVEQYGAVPESIFVAPNVVDTDAVIEDRHRFADRVNPLRKELGLVGRPVILFVGMINPAKRLDRLLEAFKRIRIEVPRAALLIVGDGPMRQDYEQEAKALGIVEDVVFAGKHVLDANLYYMLGDVFVLPGLGGLAISQAMAHGMPILSAEADGTEVDLIEEGTNGYLLTENDPVGQIVEHCVRLLENAGLRRDMGLASSRRIERQFGINRTAEIFREAIVFATR